MDRRNWLYLAAAGAGVMGGLGYQHWQAKQQATDAQPSGPAAPPVPVGANGEGFYELSFAQPDGKPLAMANYRGKRLLVNFWATWCPPCIEELPLIDAFYRENNLKNWQTLGLAVDQAQAVQRFLATKPLSFPVAMAGLAGIEMTRSLGNITGALPFSVLFDAKGDLVQRKLGKLSDADLKAWAGA